MKSRRLRIVAVVIAVLLVGIQLIPVAHSNPPATKEPQWDSPETRALFMRACGDCHSNESKWPAYSYVAPASWFVANHVKDGRFELNVSEFNVPANRLPRLLRNTEQSITRADMPLPSYLWIHPEAKLSEADKTTLINGIKASFK